jgi:hypothetical protein
MSIDSISGMSSSLGQGAGSAITDKESFGAAVVSSTLDKLNSGPSGGNSDYEFQKTVLGGHAASLGLVADYKV